MSTGDEKSHSTVVHRQQRSPRVCAAMAGCGATYPGRGGGGSRSAGIVREEEEKKSGISCRVLRSFHFPRKRKQEIEL